MIPQINQVLYDLVYETSKCKLGIAFLTNKENVCCLKCDCINEKIFVKLVILILCIKRSV